MLDKLINYIINGNKTLKNGEEIKINFKEENATLIIGEKNLLVKDTKNSKVYLLDKKSGKSEKLFV